MKNKKIIISFIVLVIVIFLVGYFAIKYVKEKKNNDLGGEYTPAEEISPYNTLVELLISGPKNEKLIGIFPENTKLLNSSIEGDCLTLDFSSEFLNYNKNDEKVKDNLINSIVNTVTELTEVNQVKILINGQVSDEFKDIYVRK